MGSSTYLVGSVRPVLYSSDGEFVNFGPARMATRPGNKEIEAPT